MERELRRCRSNLSILGSGVIAFSVWEIVKPFLIALLVPQVETDAPTEVPTNTIVDLIPRNILVLLVVAFLILITVYMWLRIHVGRAAKADAAGKRRGKSYVVLAFLLCGVQAIGFIQAVWVAIDSGPKERTILEIIASLLLEGSSLTIMAELAFTARKFRKLNEKRDG